MNETKKGKLFVVSGPSGVGKGTLVKLLLEKYPEIVLSVSATTRQPRPGEQNGVHYFFVEKEVFKDRVSNGGFLEWAEFATNLYGTDRAFVEENLEQGKNVLLEIDVKGALQIKDKKPDAILIFIKPPSIEALKDRLFRRKTESQDAIDMRLSIVKSEIEKVDEFNHSLVNDDLYEAFSHLENIMQQESTNMNKIRQEQHKCR